MVSRVFAKVAEFEKPELFFTEAAIERVLAAQRFDFLDRAERLLQRLQARPLKLMPLGSEIFRHPSCQSKHGDEQDQQEAAGDQSYIRITWSKICSS
jgi:hypothetical protein